MQDFFVLVVGEADVLELDVSDDFGKAIYCLAPARGLASLDSGGLGDASPLRRCATSVLLSRL